MMKIYVFSKTIYLWQAFGPLFVGILAYWLGRLRMVSRIELLQASLLHHEQQKSKLLMEIDERLKENLQMIISLTRLERRRVDREVINAKHAFRDLLGRFDAMAIVQRAFAHRAAASTVTADKLLKELVHHEIARARHFIVCDVETNNLEIDVLLASPLGLILHEMSSQAVILCADTQDCHIQLELSEMNGNQMMNFKLHLDGDLVPEANADRAMSNEIIEMMSDQMAATLEYHRKSTQLLWSLRYAKNRDAA